MFWEDLIALRAPMVKTKQIYANFVILCAPPASTRLLIVRLAINISSIISTSALKSVRMAILVMKQLANVRLVINPVHCAQATRPTAKLATIPGF